MDSKNFNLIDKVIARLRLREVSEFVNDNDVILDFGCGSNSFLLSSTRKKIKSGFGLDYDVEEIMNENLTYIKYKFNDGKLPFDNNFFDKIFLLAVLEHIEVGQVDKLFSEFKRILKKRGKIVLTTPTPASKGLLEFLAYRLKLISTKEILDHKKYYDKKEITKISKYCGLKLINYKLFQFGLNSRAIFLK